MHHLTHTLALTLHSANDVEEYDDVAAAIEAVGREFTQCRRADLYALLAESVTPGMPFAKLTETVDACLVKNELYFVRPLLA